MEAYDMRKLRTALLCSCILAVPLALAAGANAAEQLQPGMVLYNAAGQPVGVLAPLTGASVQVAPVGFPAQLIAEHIAMMRGMMADMQALDRAPMFTFAPDRMIQAVLHHLWDSGGTLPGSNMSEVTISSFNSGHGMCSETVTTNYVGGAVHPQVVVHKLGDACAGVAMPDLRRTPAVLPEALPAQPGGKLLKVDDPSHPVSAGMLHG
jgi:hypothetical protein